MPTIGQEVRHEPCPRRDPLPTFTSAESPPKFEPFTYASYMAWYQDLNYARASADGVRIQAY